MINAVLGFIILLILLIFYLSIDRTVAEMKEDIEEMKRKFGGPEEQDGL